MYVSDNKQEGGKREDPDHYCVSLQGRSCAQQVALSSVHYLSNVFESQNTKQVTGDCV